MNLIGPARHIAHGRTRPTRAAASSHTHMAGYGFRLGS
jgi:hypothetical protein